MMATTIMSSTKVNPVLRMFWVRVICIDWFNAAERNRTSRQATFLPRIICKTIDFIGALQPNPPEKNYLIL
jgi:hypothetical protein